MLTSMILSFAMSVAEPSEKPALSELNTTTEQTGLLNETEAGRKGVRIGRKGVRIDTKDVRIGRKGVRIGRKGVRI